MGEQAVFFPLLALFLVQSTTARPHTILFILELKHVVCTRMLLAVEKNGICFIKMSKWRGSQHHCVLRVLRVLMLYAACVGLLL